ncbi:hypothetical protein [Allocoleopsis sp.]|uniref:hypothetical protein n=1 Tax=Allocoleopsis sp. TaxID=3088169 RepID=UPI002FD5DC69
MNSKPVDTIGSGEQLSLPEPDPDNITVLTRNLPNTPILPWNHYDSPWQDSDAVATEQEADRSDQDIDNLEQNAEHAEKLESAEATAPEVTPLDGELDPTEATVPEVISLDGELDPTEATVPEVIPLDELKGQPLSVSLDPLEETPTDELTG